MLNTSKLRCMIKILVVLVHQCHQLNGFKVPEAIFQLEDNGFSLSIPDQPGIQNVAFQVNRNRPFLLYTEGDLSGVAKMEGKFWTVHFKKKLSSDDMIHVWYNVQHGQVVFRKLQSIPFAVKAYQRDSSPPTDLLPTITRPARFKGQLIFEENFDELDERVWRFEYRFPPEDGDNEHVTYYRINTPVENGVITFNLEKQSKAFLNRLKVNGVYNISDKCSYYIQKEVDCVTSNGPWAHMREIFAPRINTKDSFSFVYGRVEIKAYFPVGQWIVPIMFLEPKAPVSRSFERGQLRVAFIRGNEEEISYGSHRLDGHSLYGGPVVSNDSHSRFDYLVNVVSDKHYGEGYHVYAMIWTDKDLTFLVDDVEYGKIKLPIESGNQQFPFNEECYISLGISVGGFGDFPDIKDLHWKNGDPKHIYQFYKKEFLWAHTWSNPSLRVDYVKVYAV